MSTLADWFRPSPHMTEDFIIATLTAYPHRMGEASATLGPADFDQPEARTWWLAATERYLATGTLDLPAVSDALSSEARLWWFEHAYDLPFTDQFIRFWMRRLKQHRAVRRIVEIVGEPEVDTVADTCRAMLSYLEATAPDTAGVNWDAPLPPEQDGPAWPTGLPALDDLLGGGLRPGRLYVVAGRPGMGKSTLLRSWAWQRACQQTPTAIFTLEVGEADVRRRWHAMRQVTDGPTVPLRVFDLAPLPVAAIRSALIASRIPWGLVLVDYLQLLHAVNPRDPRERQVADLSRSLKLLARELQVAVVVACQLNREAEGRTTHEPRLADLRESGAIEADADAVLLMYRPAYYDRQADATMLSLSLAKHREGPTGMITCYWNPAQDLIRERTTP